jgi:hypothetical protein
MGASGDPHPSNSYQLSVHWRAVVPARRSGVERASGWRMVSTCRTMAFLITSAGCNTWQTWESWCRRAEPELWDRFLDNCTNARDSRGDLRADAAQFIVTLESGTEHTALVATSTPP